MLAYLASNKKVDIRHSDAPRTGSKMLMYSLAAFTSIGALLFGYDQGVMGQIVADQRFLEQFKPANSWVTGAIISLYDIGCLAGAFCSGNFSDRLGRERIMAYASIMFIIGAIIQASAFSVVQITIGRVILGVGVGACSAEVPLYLGEIAPAEIRGQLIAIEQMILCFGELIAFWVDYGFYYLDSQHWWRIPISGQVLFALALGVGSYFWVLPSPRWLAINDRREEALEVLTRLHGTNKAIIEYEMITQEIDLESSTSKSSWGEIFRMPYLKVVFQGCMCQVFQQITGTNSILYYAPSLFEKGGITNPNTANLATGGVGIVLFVTSFIPVYCFDRLGRKTWLQIATVGMMCAMIGIAVMQWHAEKFPGDPGNYAIIVFPYMFYCFFNIGWACGSWTYASEIFPLKMRAKGNALATASLWLSVYVVGQVSPVIADAIRWGLYIIYAVICVFAFIFVRYVMIETRGASLEEMSAKFGIYYDERTNVDNFSVKSAHYD
ncbi:hexose transporter Hxt13p [Trichomonascus vanleenenianus]|uniref:sugar porter family MFS transporter n=1 Tax=Trichomonascus vanleenenianus TaxID=2268995 RepID=UPI003ECB1DE7